MLLPAPAILPSQRFGNITSAKKVAVKSLELQVLQGSLLEGCSYFIFFSPLQAVAWKREAKLPWAVPPKVI